MLRIESGSFRVEQYQDTAIRGSGYVYQRKC